MRSFILLLRFLFAINPTAIAHYTDPEFLALLVMSVTLLVCSFLLKRWRRKFQNSMTRKLTASWPSAAFWFGLTGIILVVSRVERIQVIAMPFLWVIWGIIFILFLIVQWRLFATRHYEVMPRNVAVDPRDQYLPKRKK